VSSESGNADAGSLLDGTFGATGLIRNGKRKSTGWSLCNQRRRQECLRYSNKNTGATPLPGRASGTTRVWNRNAPA